MRTVQIYVSLYLLWFFAISICLGLPSVAAFLNGVSFNEIFLVLFVCSTLVYCTDLAVIFLFKRAAREGKFERKSYEMDAIKTHKIFHFLLIGKYTYNWPK